VKITVKDSGVKKALEEFAESTGRSLAAAINEAMYQVSAEAKKHVPVAQKTKITKFGKSDLAVWVALKRMKGRFSKSASTQDQVKEYIKKMVESKKAAVKFMQLLINAAAIKATGKTPEKPAGVKADGQKASNRENRLRAWVRIVYTFKGGDRTPVDKMIDAAYEPAQRLLSRNLSDQAEKIIERKIKKSGLK